MAKKQGTARRTISLPADLDRRMEKQSHVNWSSVACSAFETRLAELEPRKEPKGMQATIERLKKLAEEEKSQAYRDGAAAGKEWAHNHATPKELRRLAELLESDRSESFFDQSDADVYAASQRLVAEIQGTHKVTRHASEEFWEVLLGDGEEQQKIFDPEFAIAFANTAKMIWDEVKDQI